MRCQPAPIKANTFCIIWLFCFAFSIFSMCTEPRLIIVLLILYLCILADTRIPTSYDYSPRFPLPVGSTAALLGQIYVLYAKCLIFQFKPFWGASVRMLFFFWGGKLYIVRKWYLRISAECSILHLNSKTKNSTVGLKFWLW